MAGMVGGHSDALHCRNQWVFSDTWVLCDHLLEHRGDRLLSDGRQQCLGVIERLHSFITGTPGCQEHDGWGEVFLAKSGDEINRMNRGRHAVSFPLKSRRGRIL